MSMRIMRLLQLFCSALICGILLCGCTRSLTLERRIDDVRKLLELHAEHGLTNTDITRLLAIADQRGIRIVSPIPKDRNKPCYRIVVPMQHDLSTVVLEETSNVRDESVIVRGYADGHVSVDRRTPAK
jgi:hypothetical protein